MVPNTSNNSIVKRISERINKHILQKPNWTRSTVGTNQNLLTRSNKNPASIELQRTVGKLLYTATAAI